MKARLPQGYGKPDVNALMRQAQKNGHMGVVAAGVHHAWDAGFVGNAVFF